MQIPDTRKTRADLISEMYYGVSSQIYHATISRFIVSPKSGISVMREASTNANETLLNLDPKGVLTVSRGCKELRLVLAQCLIARGSF